MLIVANRFIRSGNQPLITFQQIDIYLNKPIELMN